MTAGFISRSHRAIQPFTLTRAQTVGEAVGRMADGALPHAGGIDVVEQLQGGHHVAEIVDISQLDELKTLEVVGDRLRIGAGVTHARIESDPTIASTRPDLAAAWKTVGNVRIRRTGTIGGNLMAFDATYDAAPILAAAGAQLVFQTLDGEVRSSVVDRASGILLTHIEIPLTGALRFERTYKPVATVAVDKFVAVGCAHDLLQVASLPTEQEASAANTAASVIEAMPDPIDDATASQAYRLRLLKVLLRRLLAGQS